MSKTNALDFGMDINHAQAILAIALYGPSFSQLYISEPGVGKSSLLAGVAEYHGDKWRKVGDYYPEDKYHYIYVDAPARDFPDFGMFMVDNATQTVKFFPSDAMMGDPRPKVIMIDERFKATKVLQPIFTRLDQEKMFGETPLPAGSVVFSTTNNASDGVGDVILAHGVNRVITYKLRKPNAEQWGAWAMEAGIHPDLIAAALLNPRFFESYLDGESAADNPYIFHPARPGAFASPRSLAKCDVIVRNMRIAGEELTRASFNGAIGVAAGERLMSILTMRQDAVDPDVVLATPDTAPLPKSVGGVYMTIFNVIAKVVTQDDLSNFLNYMSRTGKVELESVVFTLIMRNKRLSPLGNRNARIRKWAMENIDMLPNANQ
jgi:hypothetical protein